MRETRANGPRDATPEPHPGRPSERAEFSAARVGGSRGRPPAFLIGWLVVVGGIAAFALAGRTPPETAAPPVAAASGSPGAVAPSPGSEGVAPHPRHSPDAAPIVTSEPGPIQLQARRHPETIYVHGDVYGEQITWVFVSLEDSGGQIAGWASVSVPGAAGPGIDSGPSLRFDVEVAVPADVRPGPLMVHATAHDAAGRLIGTARLTLDDDDGVASAVDGGFRPGAHFPMLDASFDAHQ
jgi:hypothetical protein